MKKKLFYLIGVCMICLLLVSPTSCSNDDEDLNGLGGTWYLITYGTKYCSHGEYWQISGNTLKWNSRLGGVNTTFNISVTSNKIVAKCTYCSEDNNKSDWDTELSYYIEDGLLVTQEGSLIRTFSRIKP